MYSCKLHISHFTLIQRTCQSHPRPHTSLLLPRLCVGSMFCLSKLQAAYLRLVDFSLPEGGILMFHGKAAGLGRRIGALEGFLRSWTSPTMLWSFRWGEAHRCVVINGLFSYLWSVSTPYIWFIVSLYFLCIFRPFMSVLVIVSPFILYVSWWLLA